MHKETFYEYILCIRMFVREIYQRYNNENLWDAKNDNIVLLIKYLRLQKYLRLLTQIYIGTPLFSTATKNSYRYEKYLLLLRRFVRSAVTSAHALQYQRNCRDDLLNRKKFSISLTSEWYCQKIFFKIGLKTNLE
jgi:hypothetical protein